jgi:hypothetical protein
MKNLGCYSTRCFSWSGLGEQRLQTSTRTSGGSAEPISFLSEVPESRIVHFASFSLARDSNRRNWRAVQPALASRQAYFAEAMKHRVDLASAASCTTITLLKLDQVESFKELAIVAN